MTPEERAARLLNVGFGSPKEDQDISATVAQEIRAAETEAWNEAVEACAQIVEYDNRLWAELKALKKDPQS